MRMLWMVILVLALGAPAASAGTLSGVVKAPGMKNNADAVVYVDAIAGKTFPAPEAHARMDQKDLTFQPHVLAVQAGTTVDFFNSDAVMHNVFSPDACCEKFNLGSWAKGTSRSYTFKTPCNATVLCRVHPEMEGYVIAVPTPWFAVTDKAGAYTIKDVPDGKYTLKVWHPKFKRVATQPVSVAGATTANVELKK